MGDAVKEKGYSGIDSAHPIEYIFIIVTIACFCGFIVTIFLTPTYDGPALDAMDQHVAVDDHKEALKCLYGKGTALKGVSPEAPLTANEAGVTDAHGSEKISMC